MFFANNRVKKIKLSYSYLNIRGQDNGEPNTRVISETYNLNDTMDMQWIEFPKPILASYLKFTILEIYKGTKYPHDTCISKIKVITEKTNNIVYLTNN